MQALLCQSSGIPATHSILALATFQPIKANMQYNRNAKQAQKIETNYETDKIETEICRKKNYEDNPNPKGFGSKLFRICIGCNV